MTSSRFHVETDTRSSHQLYEPWCSALIVSTPWSIVENLRRDAVVAVRDVSRYAFRRPGLTRKRSNDPVSVIPSVHNVVNVREPTNNARDTKTLLRPCSETLQPPQSRSTVNKQCKNNAEANSQPVQQLEGEARLRAMNQLYMRLGTPVCSRSICSMHETM